MNIVEQKEREYNDLVELMARLCWTTKEDIKNEEWMPKSFDSLESIHNMLIKQIKAAGCYDLFQLGLWDTVNPYVKEAFNEKGVA